MLGLPGLASVFTVWVEADIEKSLSTTRREVAPEWQYMATNSRHWTEYTKGRGGVYQKGECLPLLKEAAATSLAVPASWEGGPVTRYSDFYRKPYMWILKGGILVLNVNNYCRFETITCMPPRKHLETLFSQQPPLVFSVLDLDYLNKKNLLTVFSYIPHNNNIL